MFPYRNHLVPPRVHRMLYLLSGIVAVVLYSLIVASAQAQSDSESKKGHEIYMAARCFACHGEMGYGGVGPRFRENRFIGMNDYVVGQILIGRGVMPSFANALDDQQIAAVATYIRNSWGNNFGSVNPDEVSRVRQEIKLSPPQGRPHLPPESRQPPN